MTEQNNYSGLVKEENARELMEIVKRLSAEKCAELLEWAKKEFPGS